MMSGELKQEDIDELELDIEELLVALDERSLEDLAAGVNIDERTWKGKHKLVIFRSIRKFVAGLIVNETELSVKKEKSGEVY